METETKHKYRYYLEKDYTLWYDFTFLFSQTSLFCIKLEWGEIFRDKIIIYKNYAWDGATGPIWQGKKITQDQYPTIKLPVLQTRSEPIRDTTVATLLHDILYQFLNEISHQSNLKLNEVRRFSDIAFRDLLIKFNFHFYRLYYRGVRFFGKIWIRIGEIFS